MACEALFNNHCFLFQFLPITLFAYWLVPSRRWKLACISVAGIVFYSFWDIRFVALLLAAAVVDFLLAHAMVRVPAHRKRWLVGSMLFNLGVLAIFKYAVFVTDNARSIFDVLGLPIELPYFSIVLPVGISFFTFKTMSYTIDVYRGEVTATRDFLKYLAFITLFADMVAGPIVRYRSLSDQFDALPRRLSGTMVKTGLVLLSIGLFKKVVVADTVARYVDPLWAASGTLTTLDAWVAAIGFTIQLYFDFSGYSDMAIGLGFLLGVVIPANFRAPYQALNPTDFWRRWHISLSTWLRDYLYVPLGGNRGSARRIYINLLLVMLLGGLWHGAAWTFVLWGAYHGALLVVYKFSQPAWDAVPKPAQRAGMFLLVVMGWVLFRAPDVPTALTMYGALVVPNLAPAVLASVAPSGLGGMRFVLVLLGVLLAAVMLLRPTSEMSFRARWRPLVVGGGLFAISLAFITADSPFLYYQF